MTVDAWLSWACEDARRRGLEDLPALLETLARSTRALRAADEAAREQGPPPHPERTEDAR